jgi:IS5 family transposase
LEITEDRNENEDDNHSDSGLSVSSSKDPDVKWLKKGKKSFYGYKAFAVSDNEGYILETSVKPANVGECKELESLISELKADRILADKAYASKANREMLLMKGFKDGILHKAVKNKPLRASQKKFNKLI